MRETYPYRCFDGSIFISISPMRIFYFQIGWILFLLRIEWYRQLQYILNSHVLQLQWNMTRKSNAVQMRRGNVWSEETHLLKADDVRMMAKKFLEQPPPPRPPLQGGRGTSHKSVVLGSQRLWQLVPLQDPQGELRLSRDSIRPGAPVKRGRKARKLSLASCQQLRNRSLWKVQVIVWVRLPLGLGNSSEWPHPEKEKLLKCK